MMGWQIIFKKKNQLKLPHHWEVRGKAGRVKKTNSKNNWKSLDKEDEVYKLCIGLKSELWEWDDPDVGRWEENVMKLAISTLPCIRKTRSRTAGGKRPTDVKQFYQYYYTVK